MVQICGLENFSGKLLSCFLFRCFDLVVCILAIEYANSAKVRREIQVVVFNYFATVKYEDVSFFKIAFAVVHIPSHAAKASLKSALGFSVQFRYM